MSTPHERVGALRSFHKLTPTQFARQVGCTRQMVVYVERGERRAGVDMIHAIEALSLKPRASDGLVWPEGPLATEEWVSTSVPATHDTDEQPPTDVVMPSDVQTQAEAIDAADTAA